MSATRNPYYQLPGGAELPGDVRVSDTADAGKTAADGWAASPAAVANAVPEMEYGCFVSPTTISENKIYQYTVNFSNSHADVPKTVLLSYRTYSYFNGYVHIDTDMKDAGVDRFGFTFVYIPQDIGNGLANLLVDWIAIW